ncbi:hypothetical protein SARC_12031 [Sphaeroforma arctica JP610]|uniref:Alkyl sulfatase dimerisation domain-containing protein n=1 Tax=Sphaeroforma arctica JP610 TaxID=667725 RepID=A0A0L0FHB7_9EUKA|nr:hypothetical protein SARC_12031 [Sphaeroforma arctica JP610]KNC75443.1 hypothetical protein SARC_12031 [Sphaeroforma arctica JP610]|eukprot:XP_014149345.1 hypothetical protein SARC_12031 [Sphaeroforma arctica JP610]
MDHFGGVLGLVDEAGWSKGNIQVVAPLNFADEALSENYMVIGKMGRRAWWQFGNLLPANENASIHAVLSFTQSNFLFAYAEDTLEITKDIVTHTIAGINFEFMLTLSAEAPAEMHTWVENWGLLNTDENAVMSAHNFLTLRGAKARDPVKWTTETIEMPKSIDSYFNTRGHYGHLKHNSKEVYQFYVGWWDGNPAGFQHLPPVERVWLTWVGLRLLSSEANGITTTVTTDGVLKARYLEADCLEQIGYAEESGIRRNFMLTGTQELRHGKKAYPEPDLDESFLFEMPLWMMLQSLEIKIDPTMAEKSNGLSLNLEVKDTNEMFNIIISQAVLISLPVDV